MKIKKGDVGYIQAQKRKRVVTTILFFLIPVVIFVSGYLYHGTRENVLTVVSIVGCLPACKSLVGVIMIMMQKTKPREYYQEILQHAGDLTMAYEMIFTTYEKNVRIDAAAICGSMIVCFADQEAQGQVSFITEHLTKMLKHNGYPTSVHVLTSKDKFIDRLDSLNKNKKSLEEGFYPEWMEEIKKVMLNLTL